MLIIVLLHNTTDNISRPTNYPRMKALFALKNCAPMTEIIIVARSREFARIFKIDAHIHSLADL